MKYVLQRKVDHDFSTTVEKVTEELAKEGFGVLTHIDVKATLKKKLDVDFRNYLILGCVFRSKTATDSAAKWATCSGVNWTRHSAINWATDSDPIWATFS